MIRKRFRFTSFLESTVRKFVSVERRKKLKKSLNPTLMNIIKKIFNYDIKDAQINIKRYHLLIYNLGFTKKGLEELWNVIQKSNSYRRPFAIWELCLWYADQYTEEGARQCLELLSQLSQYELGQKQRRQVAVIKSECYEILGEIQAAKQTILQAISDDENADLFLAAANLESSESKRIEWINKALNFYGISNIYLDDSPGGHAYDRLKSKSKGIAPNDSLGPKVSVIMPVYNAEAVITTALDSVISQTWTNLEILVVDDCSTDSTVEIVQAYANKDPRVRLICAESNGGAYVSRNLGLRESSGDFVTCHDADDWSHPEKIEIQVRHLLEHTSVIANTSQLARATNDLKFYRRGRPGSYIFGNMSSLLFRREAVLDAIGYWDSVRFGADGEFKRRLKKAFGDEAVVDLQSGPLSFPRQSIESLTGNEAFGYQGFMMGARREYFEAYDYYQNKVKEWRYDFPQDVRPFPVPEPMLPVREAKVNGFRHFDVIIASDFRLPGGTTTSNMEEIKAQKQRGLRTGLIQMSRYQLDPEKIINPKLRDLIDGNQVQMIVYGEKVSCDLLIVRHPPVLQEWQKYIPEVKAADIRVIVNQTPLRDYGVKSSPVYNIEQCAKHLRGYFGKEGIWHPIGPLVREALLKYHETELKSVTLADEDWSNIINVSEWQRTTRPARGSKIRIGRHSRDQYVKWPEDPKELLAAYPDDPDFEVHVLGGADTPTEVLGRLPNNWRVINFGEMHPKKFLSTIDVYVYYTHPNWIEAFGRVIIEAMAVGVPVILPYEYKELFKESAIYARPFEVKKKIEELMSDDEYYESQVVKARDYVEIQFGYTKHFTRISNITN